MVVCTVCQGEQFDLQDGHYYCRDCHTQALVMGRLFFVGIYFKGFVILGLERGRT
jgi:hypothetical protein